MQSNFIYIHKDVISINVKKEYSTILNNLSRSRLKICEPYVLDTDG